MQEKILIVSPHPDDACFSLGGYILKKFKSEITVWDVFSRQEYSIDNNKNPKDQVIQEEKYAMSDLNVNLIMEDLPEAGLRGYGKLSDILNYSFQDFNESHIGESVFKSFGRVIKTVAPNIVLIPMGCGAHVDHLIAREFIFKWWSEKQNDIKLFLYEELPYGLNRDWFEKSLASLAYNIRENFINIDDFINEKAKIMAIYISQIKDREIQAIVKHSNSIKQGHYIERVWQVKDKK